jgi:hypothetical protein
MVSLDFRSANERRDFGSLCNGITKTPHVSVRRCVFWITLFRGYFTKHKFLTESREVFMVMVMVKRAVFMLGGILCDGLECVKVNHRCGMS